MYKLQNKNVLFHYWDMTCYAIGCSLCPHALFSHIYWYIAHRIVLSLYRCIDTKSNCIDILRIMIHWRIVACFNDLQSNYCTMWWYIMLLKEKKTHLFLLKTMFWLHFVSHNISLYCDTSETIYRHIYTLYHCTLVATQGRI